VCLVSSDLILFDVFYCNTRPVPPRTVLFLTACNMVCPSDTPDEALGSIHPNSLNILRDTMAFLLLLGTAATAAAPVADSAEGKNSVDAIRDGSALKHEQLMVRVFTAFEMESSMCKAMCAVTVIQLTMGDVVQAEQTFLQEHLNNKQYLNSQECRLAEMFINAIKNHDVDKVSVVIFYYDIK
jgi:hypothetical protein